MKISSGSSDICDFADADVVDADDGGDADAMFCVAIAAVMTTVVVACGDRAEPRRAKIIRK